MRSRRRRTPRRTGLRRLTGGALTVLSGALVWAALTGPNDAADLHGWVFLRLPVEGLVLAAVLLLLPPRVRRVTAAVAGLVLGAVLILKVLDMAFYETLDRPFDPVVDWGYLGPLIGLVVDSVGRTAGVGVLATVALLVVGLLLATPLAVLRLTRLAVAHRLASWRVAAVAAALCLLASVLGLFGVPVGPVVSTSASTYAFGQVRRIPQQIQDERTFARATVADPLRHASPDRLLTGLRGKDVLFVFVESYGRVAVQGSSFSPGVDDVLDRGTRTLRSAGFDARSAFLTSPTFGGISWLAHSTLQSGLWVDSQQRYSVLLKSSRSTLSKAFHSAGWRTVSDVPSDTRPWPQGRFYGYDRFYDAGNVGYAGPRFGYPTMPDQYTLDAFHRLELSHRPRRPVMAEIDLVSSHAPWSRTPHLVDQRAIGDGSLFEGMPQRAPSKSVIWRSTQRVRDAYGQSIEYSLSSVIDFVKTYGDDNLVVVMLGDHQPATIVSGSSAGHDVPVTVLARDPAVLHRIAPWHWQSGMRPHPDAPVWRMDAFRDRFLTAFGASPKPGLRGRQRSH
jgi:hypothetical protein